MQVKSIRNFQLSTVAFSAQIGPLAYGMSVASTGERWGERSYGVRSASLGLYNSSVYI